ncbi:MAG: HEAT repeat domain-containing protein [Gammaproteobacteria bacterium]
MRIRRFGQHLAWAVLGLLACSNAVAAVPWSVEQGATRVLLVTADDATQSELTRVAQALQLYYGATADTTHLLFRDAARAETIERALFELFRQTSSRDTLIIVLGLALHNEGRILITHDFDPERPWTGLSLDLLQKLAMGGIAGTYWQFTPSCGPATKAEFGTVRQTSNAYLGETGIGMSVVTFCEAGGMSPGREFARALATMLEDAAAYRTGQGSAGAVIAMDEVFGRLSKAARDVQVRREYVAARGATLRVRAAARSPGDLYASLIAASTDADVIAVLDRAVEQSRSSNDTVNAAQIADTLVKYAVTTSVDMNRRARAVQALGSLPADAARPALERVFAMAGDGALRATALREWQRVAKPGDTSLIHAGLGDTDSAVQTAALFAAASAGDKSLSDVVIKALRSDDDARVKAAAARALLAVAEPAIAEAVLVAALQDGAETVRAETAGSLGQLPLSAAAARPLLAVATSDSSPLVREKATYALGALWPQLPDEEQLIVQRALLDIVGTPKEAEGVRIAAVHAFGRRGVAAGSERIVSIARRNSEPPALRRMAIDVIGQLKLGSAVAVLANIADDEKEKTDLRIAAVAALGSIGDGRATDALWELTAGNSVDVAAVARRALDQATTYPRAAAAAIADAELPIERRAAAARLLGNAPDARAFDVLISALADPSQELLESVIAALSRFEQPPYPERMAEVLASPGDAARRSRVGVALALASMNSEASRGILATQAAAPDEGVRYAVAVGLGATQATQEEYGALAALSRDRSARVKTATAASLGGIENFNVADILEPMTKDEDAGVRAAAVEAIRAVLARGTPSQRR